MEIMNHGDHEVQEDHPRPPESMKTMETIEKPELDLPCGKKKTPVLFLLLLLHHN